MPIVWESLEPEPPATLGASLGLYMGNFTFTVYFSLKKLSTWILKKNSRNESSLTKNRVFLTTRSQLISTFNLIKLITAPSWWQQV